MIRRLEETGRDDDLVCLRATAPLEAGSRPRTLSYATRTGALLRIDGVARGAFDGEHRSIAVRASLHGTLELEVERRALPTRGLPPGDGLTWRTMLARARQRASRVLHLHDRAELPPAPAPPAARLRSRALALTGHSHLDVAWLWTYAEAARKALRTFATAVRQLDLAPAFVFTQSQPQLYAFVRAQDADLFARVAALARTGRFDASGAAMWVEADCNLPSGESLLRQLVVGIRFAEGELGTTPTVAWLPDSFGFPNTLPTLLRHAGVAAFGTTKLGWNDTTRFPYARFTWEGPDGSRVTAAQLASIAGSFERERVRAARGRGDLLLVGEGDGGGGVSDRALASAPALGTWTTLGAWFARVAHEGALAVVRDELYLEEHRGTLTTHHDVKARNAALERALRDAEEAVAWASVLRATPFFLKEARRQLDEVWEIVLRAQFHDVLPGSAVASVYADVRREYERAEALVDHVTRNARSVLPTAGVRPPVALVPPLPVSDGYAFENAALCATVRRDGTLAELRVPGGANLVRCAHRLALYVDRPRHWDAWNLDRSYRRRPRHLRATACSIVDDALEVRYALGRSRAVARFSLRADEPLLRVELAVAWHERHRVLRCENGLRFAAHRARFGTPHGSIVRPVAPRSRAERAKFEAPGQRYARLDGPRGGVALLTLDTYGWSLERRNGRSRLGHSLLRAPAWPDPGADRGEHVFSYAYLPFARLGVGELESLWERFARAPSVAMFVPDVPNVVVAATKRADDGDGIVVRLRECDGRAVRARIAYGLRARSAVPVDALEREVRGDVALDDGRLEAAFAPFELRSFRVRSH